MRGTNIAISLIFVAISAYVLISARNLDYYTPLGPGPAFFPVWIAIILATMSTAWLLTCVLQPARLTKTLDWPSKTAIIRIAATISALFGYVWVSEVIGFRISAFVFLFFILGFVGRQSVAITFFGAAVGSIGAYYLFHDILGVYLPMASVEFLRELGI